MSLWNAYHFPYSLIKWIKPLRFVWSEVYKSDEAFIVDLANPAVSEYLQKHPKLADDFTVEVYGTVGDKCLEVMNGTGVPFRVFITKIGIQ